MAATAELDLETIPIIDVDTHVTEPADLWTSRLPSRFGDKVPHVVTEPSGAEMWYLGDRRLSGAAKFAAAGWRDYPPSYPPRYDQADSAAWDPVQRLQRMDEYGLHTQVLYPNILAFYMPMMFSLDDLALTKACVLAYNDFLADFCRVNPDRLVPLMMLPFWDAGASVAEIARAAALGHRGIVFASNFDKVGLPRIWDEHWTPILAAAQDAGLSVNFHVGFGELTEDELVKRTETDGADHTRQTSVGMLGNARAIADVITSGLCHRYPKLNFVSVESGVGWLPYLMDSLDWHWKNYGGRRDFPERELPSFYFKRQVYGSYWFERETVPSAVMRLPDTCMFASDFPHPTSLSPGPASVADQPAAMAKASLAGVPLEIARKVLHGNAARLYRLG
jgi:predicted TIM-barrel fold metal-dependent hydrolase